MSTRITGRITSDVRDDRGQLTGLPGLRVSLQSTGGLLGLEIGHGISGNDGQFDLSYRADPFGGRPLELVVHDRVGRELHRFESIRDEDVEVLSKGDFTLHHNEAGGWLVTLGTGAHAAGAGTLPGWGLSQGNSVAWMIDQDAFKHAAGLLARARRSVLMSQLFFPVPTSFGTEPADELVKLIFDFEKPAPDPTNLPRKTLPKDKRPERLIVDAAAKGLSVRVLLHAYEVPLFIKIALGLLIFPFAGTDGVAHVVGELLDDDLTDTDEVQRYFGESGRTNVLVRPFEQPVLSAGVMHAKLVTVDRTHALSIGSPFGQSYVDTPDHAIDAPMRGDSSGFPKHDAGFSVQGPGAALLFETLRLLWDTASPDDKVPQNDPEPASAPPPPAEPATADPLDGVCSMQVVRTLTAGRFDGFEDGEKGILEAYLRAFNEAEDFVYLETQYFTDDLIGAALVNAMNRKPGLQVVVLLNIRPDVPFYPFKQRRLITRIREGIGQADRNGPRFGVFTRWSHDHGGPRPRLLPVYVHAKVGIVDNHWATVGSANLDGLSLDSIMVSDVLNFLPRKLAGRPLFREQRAVEVNAVMFDGIAGQPQNPAVDALRRRLWAEHLGYRLADGGLDLQHADLDAKPADGWLGLWSRRAAQTLKHLTDTPAQSSAGLGRVLPWPDDDTTYKAPREHLTALGIKSFKVVPLKSTRAFDFESGDWKKDSQAKMDYD